MNENSPQTDLLIQFLDGELPREQMDSLKKSLTENPALREELENLRLAKEAVKSYGLKNRVRLIHSEMMQEFKKTAVPKTSLVKMITRHGLRVAAVLIVLFGISTLYQYITSTPEKLFTENFKTFDLHTTRGNFNTILEDLYEKGDMQGLIQQFILMKTPEAKDYFLAGNAYLGIHEAALAVKTFLKLGQLNKTNNTHFYEEDLEYYLALGYLGSGKPAKALPILEKIHADQNHPYHEAVSAWLIRKVKRTVKA